MPKLNLADIEIRTACGYPEHLAKHCEGRAKQALGDAGDLTQFGVNFTRLPPGAASAHKHWHETEDEFIYIVEGEAVLVEDSGESTLRAGDAATFKAGVADGHMLVNRSNKDVVFLEVGTRADADSVTYTDPDVDLKMTKKAGEPWVPSRKNGEAY